MSPIIDVIMGLFLSSQSVTTSSFVVEHPLTSDPVFYFGYSSSFGKEVLNTLLGSLRLLLSFDLQPDGYILCVMKVGIRSTFPSHSVSGCAGAVC